MPAINVQMSRSSSTIRISWAMTLQTVRCVLGGSLSCCCMQSARRDLPRIASEYQTDARTATFTVSERKLSTVILHDLLDDREAKTGPLAPRRDIWLGHALAAFARKSPAVVLDDDAH